MAQDDNTTDTTEYKPALIDPEAFQTILGVQFEDSAVLERALTHRSYANENAPDGVQNNERLEFLGDAILDFIVADMLFRRFPNMTEGEMTRVRAALVRTEALAKLGAECRIGEALRMGRGEERSGGRERETNVCRAFEALIGAIYLDKGLETVRDFVIPRFNALQDSVMDDAINKDPRSQFQEWAQAVHGITPTFHVTGTDGPEHEIEFVVEAHLGAQSVAEGRGRSKRAAAQSAATTALDLLSRGRLQFTAPESAQTDDDHR
ncbi:MAG: ribonuclease III [Anaerolineaceae bacterium]|nr:MAG: ribonuclease III [Anaerolineaceae bacterium]